MKRYCNRLLSVVLLAGALLACGFVSSAAPPSPAGEVRVSKEQFSGYIEKWSEPEGYFDTDNFISNETSYLHVIPDLERRVKPGGVYIGVGPDQNFSYIVHTKPALAVIVDIRRQNMLEHLWYKALFEMSSSRAEFLSNMFLRKAPTVARGATLPEVLRAVKAAPRQTASGALDKGFAAMRTWLVDRDGIKLSADDLVKIRYVYESFAKEGPELRFSTLGRTNGTRYPSYEELMVETDRQGKLQHYLATEDSYEWMKRFETENRLVPIVGDFAGPRAFKNVATFLKANDLRVSTFYTSNVEYYIFGGAQWTAYLSNVRALPATSDAVFVRAYFGTGQQHPQNVPGHRSTSLVDGLAGFLADEARGRISSYWDVVNR